MKSDRQNEIVRIIGSYDIETQDDLIKRLEEIGYIVTQATVSRDIRELKLTKVPAGGNSYKYALPAEEPKKYTDKFHNIIRETVISLDFAGNMIVLKTIPGMAQAAAAAIDGIGWNEIVGSIAGDDTIFVLMRTGAKAAEYTENFRSIMNLES